MYSITKEQAEILLPLLPTLLSQQRQSQSENEHQQLEVARYSIDEMFVKKKKNSRCTPVQNYLLCFHVSVHEQYYTNNTTTRVICTHCLQKNVVRASAKAANIWENPPLMRSLTSSQASKFFDTAFTMCPQLKSCRSLLATRLSRTLINRRQFVKRLNRSKSRNMGNFKVSSTKEQSAINDIQANTESDVSSADTPSITTSLTTATAPPTKEAPVTAKNELKVDDSKVTSPKPGDTVIIANGDGRHIGKGVFLNMNSNEDYEQFAKMMFLSAKKQKEKLEIELPMQSEQGKYRFYDLKAGDIFVWKTSRLLPAPSLQTAISQTSVAPRYMASPTPQLENNDLSEGSSDEEYLEEEFSEYEIERFKRISNNKKKFDDAYKNLKAKKTKEEKRAKASSDLEKQRNSKPDDMKQTESTSVASTPAVGEFVAVQCNKYHERPLIGCVSEKLDGAVRIMWYIGTYSGTWKQWKGRCKGKYVTFQDVISLQDVLMRNISFTKSMRLSPKTVTLLKELYV